MQTRDQVQSQDYYNQHFQQQMQGHSSFPSTAMTVGFVDHQDEDMTRHPAPQFQD